MQKTIIHTSDWHLDVQNRFEETLETIDDLIFQGSAMHPDLWVIAGDSYPVNVRASLPRERIELRRRLRKMAIAAPVVVVRGNHDCVPSDLDILDDPGSGIHVFTEPDVLTINGISVATLPWPSKAFLVSKLPDGASTGTIDEQCRRALQGILNGVRLIWEDDPAPKLLVGHVNVAGADAGGFTLVGEDVEVSWQDLEATGADYVALGHIHKMQQFGVHVAFCGSPRRVDFGEEGEDKGFLVARIEAASPNPVLPVIDFIPTKTRPMQTIELTADTVDVPQVIPGANLRLIFDLTMAERERMDMAARLAELGVYNDARSVRTEVRIRTDTRVRSEAIREARTDEERLAAWLDQLEPVVAPEDRARLLQIASEMKGNW